MEQDLLGIGFDSIVGFDIRKLFGPEVATGLNTIASKCIEGTRRVPKRSDKGRKFLQCDPIVVYAKKILGRTLSCYDNCLYCLHPHFLTALPSLMMQNTLG